jgi:predicted phage terminase large subunit-like protein
MTNKDLAEIMIDLARRDFYYYCRFRIPKVYTENRPHLKVLARQLQAFWESQDKYNLILNMPPRHGKTLTVELLVEWVLGKNPTIGVMAACYNELLSTRFSKAVRSGIQEKSVKIEKPTFSGYFPGVKIKEGDGAMQMWALEGSHFSFLATSPGGTATGIGAQLLVIDDLIKNADEAYNERVLESHVDWYDNTMLSRLESGAKQIIIQTRWSERDLSGVLLARDPDLWEHIIMPAQGPDGTMLCDDILDAGTFEKKKQTLDPVILAGNYQQEPYDNVDKLYGELKTYTKGMVPKGRREAYIDTADEGKDFLAGACYTVANNTAYITDLIYTQDAMETTEGQTALMLSEQKTQLAHIESNNGGRGFARNVERILREISGYTGCQVKWFHQGQNKQARILSTATNVVNSVIMPEDWKTRWPLFYSHVTKAGRRSKMVHDDFADMLAGIVEKSLTKNQITGASKEVRAALGYG